MRELKEIFENAQAALNDEKDAIKTYEDIEEVSRQVEQLKTSLKPKVLDELQNHNGEYKSRYFSFKQIEAGVKYEFEATNHPKWHELTEQINDLIEQRKEIETFLKSVKKPTELLFDDEVITIYPTPKKSTTTFKLTLNK